MCLLQDQYKKLTLQNQLKIVMSIQDKEKAQKQGDVLDKQKAQNQGGDCWDPKIVV